MPFIQTQQASWSVCIAAAVDSQAVCVGSLLLLQCCRFVWLPTTVQTLKRSHDDAVCLTAAGWYVSKAVAMLMSVRIVCRRGQTFKKVLVDTVHLDVQSCVSRHMTTAALLVSLCHQSVLHFKGRQLKRLPADTVYLTFNKVMVL